jgi:hypothetical protein
VATVVAVMELLVENQTTAQSHKTHLSTEFLTQVAVAELPQKMDKQPQGLLRKHLVKADQADQALL